MQVIDISRITILNRTAPLSSAREVHMCGIGYVKFITMKNIARRIRVIPASLKLSMFLSRTS